MAETLIKISDDDCPICFELAKKDGSIAREKKMEFEVIRLQHLAPQNGTGSPIYEYVKSVYVADDGMVDLPVYLVVDGPLIKASGVIKNAEELTNLIESWELYKSAQSSGSATA